MTSLNNQLTKAALKYLGGEALGKRSAEAVWRKAMIQYLGGGAGLGRLSLEALANRAARQYLGDTTSRSSLDNLLLRWAYAVAGGGTPGRLSLNGAAMRALDKYLTTPVGPAFTINPVVTGTPEVGQVLSATTGTATGTGTVSYAYQWVNSVSGPIGGATASTYTLQASDSGDNVWCVVTATDDNGSTPQASNIVGPTGAGKTYAEFLSHIATEATGGALGWASFDTTAAGTFRTTAATASDFMQGSPWMTEVRPGWFYPCSLVRHGLVDVTAFNDQITNGGQIMFRMVATTSGIVSAVNRNGFTSSANTSVSRQRCDLLVFWDFTLNKARQMNPYAGTGPTDYVW